jgi:hypothetical protein
VFFVAVFIWILKIDNNYIKKMKELPLELDNDRNLNSTGEKNDE